MKTISALSSSLLVAVALTQIYSLVADEYETKPAYDNPPKTEYATPPRPTVYNPPTKAPTTKPTTAKTTQYIYIPPSTVPTTKPTTASTTKPSTAKPTQYPLPTKAPTPYVPSATTTSKNVYPNDPETTTQSGGYAEPARCRLTEAGIKEAQESIRKLKEALLPSGGGLISGILASVLKFLSELLGGLGGVSGNNPSITGDSKADAEKTIAILTQSLKDCNVSYIP